MAEARTCNPILSNLKQHSALISTTRVDTRNGPRMLRVREADHLHASLVLWHELITWIETSVIVFSGGGCVNASKRCTDAFTRTLGHYGTLIIKALLGAGLYEVAKGL